MLKNSSFICEGVFADLPQSFLDKCYGWQGSHLVAIDKRKYNYNNNYNNYNAAGSSGGRGRGQKRQGSASNPRAKRGKYSNNNISNYTPAQSSVFLMPDPTPGGGGCKQICTLESESRERSCEELAWLASLATH